MELSIAETKWELQPGDVVVFRGDQKHAYRNHGMHAAVAYSIVALVPVVD